MNNEKLLLFCIIFICVKNLIISRLYAILNNKKPSTNWGNLIAYHLNAWAVKQYRLDNNKLTYRSKSQMSDESEQNFYATLNATYNQYAQGADNAEDVNSIPLLNLNVNQKGA